LGRDPDLIIVPNIVDVRGNDAVRTWVRRHGCGSPMRFTMTAPDSSTTRRCLNSNEAHAMRSSF
ncbi:MAG TPA: hypothetical protein VE665_08130, partial [Hyphomicrobiaceae bacterium]|nr:hypothetical protein [Hyphomicrobiaceae bacterium]